jgi:hypothetical protein
LPLLFFVFSISVLVLSCLYCSGLLLFYCGYVSHVPLFWLRLPLFVNFSTSVLVLCCLYCSGLLFYGGYVPLVPLFWLRLSLFVNFSTSGLALSFSCGGLNFSLEFFLSLMKLLGIS